MSYFMDDAIRDMTNIPISTGRRRRHPSSQTRYLLSHDQYRQFEDSLRSNTSSEIEISLGTFHGTNFVPGVRISQFYRLLDFMKTQNVFQEPIEITKEYRVGNMRKIIYEDETEKYETKERIYIIDSKEWFFRIRVSKETDIFDIKEIKDRFDFSKDIIEEGTIVAHPTDKVIRFKTRYSFIGTENSIYSGTRIDLTLVIQDNGLSIRRYYEVEIEKLNTASIDATRFLKIVKKLLMICQDIDEEERILINSDINRIAREYNNLFIKDIGNRQLKMSPGQFFENKNKPKAIKIKDFLDGNNYAITIKYDGLRKFLYISNDGIYIIEPRYEIQKLKGISKINETLLDGELLIQNDQRSYYVFDILFFKGKDVRMDELSQRLLYIKEAVENTQIEKLPIYSKKFFNIDSDEFYEAAAAANTDEEETKELGIPIDGWIFQPKYLPYKNENTFKWKPKELLTIDFYLQHKEGSTYLLFVKARKNNELFTGTQSAPFSGEVNIISNQFTLQDLNGHIVEMKWEDDTFVPLRIRFDRPDPNFKDWAIDLWKDIQNPISKRTLIGADLKVLRCWFNFKKRNAINSFIQNGSVLLDIGSGRGGDIGKWKRKNLDVFVIDPDKEVLLEMKRRQSTLKYNKLSYISTGIQNTKLVTEFMKLKAETKTLKTDWRADTATAFFSLQFLKSEEIDAAIKTFKKSLKPDAYIIGIVMDGDSVIQLLEEYNNEYMSSSGAWSIKLTSGAELTFGEKIIVNIADENSMVHDVEEYIFDFEEFRTKMIRSGFSLDSTYMYDNISETTRLVLPKYGKTFYATTKQYETLPKDSIKWASLQRFFIFKRTPIKSYPQLNMLKMDEIQGFDSLFRKERLFRIGTIGEGSCFFHALIRAFSRKYISMNPNPENRSRLFQELQSSKKSKDKTVVENIKTEIKKIDKQLKNVSKERMEFVARVRKKLAQKLSFDIYKQLGNGILAEVMKDRYINRASSPGNAEKLGWAIYLQKLSNCQEWIGEEAIEYVSNVLGLDIYIMRDTTRDVYPLGADCENLYQGRPSVILMNLGNIHYETVGKINAAGEYQTLFKYNDPLITKMYHKLCD